MHFVYVHDAKIVKENGFTLQILFQLSTKNVQNLMQCILFNEL